MGGQRGDWRGAGGRDTVAGVNQYNPYQAPQMNDPSSMGGMGGPGNGPNDAALMAILDSMKKTRPWVLFLAILGFLGAGGMVMLGLMMMAMGSAMSSLTKAMPGFGAWIGIFYIVLGGIYVVPSILLFRYGSSIGDFSRSGGSLDALAGAVQKQTTFWRFVGIGTAVLMGLYVVAIVIGVIVGVATAVGR